MRPDNLALARVIIAETPDFPQLGDLFRSNTAYKNFRFMAALLERAPSPSQYSTADSKMDRATYHCCGSPRAKGSNTSNNTYPSAASQLPPNHSGRRIAEAASFKKEALSHTASPSM